MSDQADVFEEAEEQPYLYGCTCEHDADQHNWTGCTVCDCKGHWEE